ncbi:cation transporter [Acetobacteraceae bacterium KSS8]|uniref:Cation transporter n=1 Tax=Endosaccharibacter trunci TaxID=2812733 RepID=A0ABT1W8S7_9PROT|nr:cation transporter [Acetobacteraceae bacterium KSS8]
MTTLMTTLAVSGMTCGHCVRAVTEAIHGIDASATVDVDLKAGTVSTDSALPADRLAQAIAAEGYEVKNAA